MKRTFITMTLGLLVFLGTRRVEAATPPATADFAAKVDLSDLRAISLQEAQTVKTLDSFARQTLERITGSSSFNRQDPVFTLLDIAYRPGDYQSQNMIKIRNLPLRTEFRRLKSIPMEEQDRIVSSGMVSLEFLNRQDVHDLLANVPANDVHKGEACQQVELARREMEMLCTGVGRGELFIPAAVVPPAAGTSGTNWRHLVELEANVPGLLQADPAHPGSLPPPVAGYTAQQVSQSLMSADKLHEDWREHNADAVNTDAATLAASLAHLNPAVYPSELIRHVEVVYNRLAKMTLPGAAFYFFALVCFLMSTRSGLLSLRMWGLRLLVLGFIIHSAGIAVRWWLTGSWLPPIKNEFESVMFSAWFGVLLGLVLELGGFEALRRFFSKIWRGNSTAALPPDRGPAGYGILGAAASFVGFLSLIAIFTVPYVLHVSIGENVGQVNGVLMSYWLYIHVTMVTASYSMIGMAFLLSCWWLIKYYIDYGTLSRLSSRQMESGGHGFEPVFPAGGGNAGASLTMTATVAKMLFFPVATAKPAKKIRMADKVLHGDSANFLATLDACNLVVLQLAFWTLGTGIILGAIWADESWGRFWAWDPKETFALVTWIAYLIIVHVRVATQDKAWWTSVLSIIGFFLMLFNWIGVNYFLPGLHSYAG